MLDGADNVLTSVDLPAGEAGWQRFRELIESWPAFGVSAHRVVHGGDRFKSGVLIDDQVVEELEKLSALAPLHNPPALAGIGTLREVRPELPAVACFDTAFHDSLPPEVAIYGIPWEWTEQLGVRRFGFHGLSHAYAARRAAEMIGRPPEDLKVVTCHLGAGASLAAVAEGRSVDTTMGFTPLEGLIMATRSGSFDPGAVLWLQEQLDLSPASMTDKLEHSAGLLGMSGLSGDMREILAAADRGEPRSRLALAAYSHRVRCGIAAMAASMGGVDAIVFTGGVGESSPRVRELACLDLNFLGVELNAQTNAEARDDADISSSTAATKVFVIKAREDLEMAAEARRLRGRKGR
jgi:acetate kinase